MRSTILTSAFLTTAFVITSHAQLIPFFAKSKPSTPAQRLSPHNQRPMDSNNAPNIQLPPTVDDSKGKRPDDIPPGAVILSDVIGSQTSINIFAGFTRDLSSVSNRLDSTSENTTVLAPLNSAITSLPRKPWEDPREYAALGERAYAGEEGEDRAHRNLRRFTEAHVLPVSPWVEGKDGKVKSMNGGTLWWETRGGKSVVMPGEIEVERIANRVANGEVWVLKGVVNYAA